MPARPHFARQLFLWEVYYRSSQSILGEGGVGSILYIQPKYIGRGRCGKYIIHPAKVYREKEVWEVYYTSSQSILGEGGVRKYIIHPAKVYREREVWEVYYTSSQSILGEGGVGSIL